MISGEHDIREAYRDQTLARSYVEQRFRDPLGALLHDRQVSHLRRLIARAKPTRALEIAPGPLRLTREIAGNLPRGIVVVDASAAMLGQARGLIHELKIKPHLVQGDAFALPLKGSFDLIYSFRLIRHFDAADRRRLYAEARRLLAPGGLFVFDAVNRASAERLHVNGFGAHEYYDALLSKADLERELTDAGLQDITFSGVQYRYETQYALQVYVAPRARPVARAAMEVVDRLGGEPLEWIVTCTAR